MNDRPPLPGLPNKPHPGRRRADALAFSSPVLVELDVGKIGPKLRPGLGQS